jgi:hypothetical protein
MANETRHAAWQTERRFAVRLLPEDGPPADLASGLTEFLDAFDLASEWVSREDPARDGTASLAIVETHDGVAEEVWTYTPGQPPADDVSQPTAQHEKAAKGERIAADHPLDVLSR